MRTTRELNIIKVLEAKRQVCIQLRIKYESIGRSEDARVAHHKAETYRQVITLVSSDRDLDLQILMHGIDLEEETK